jgi:hypothetical protein
MTGFIGTSLQLRSIITVHNQWLSETRSVPYWTTIVFSSTVTNDERRTTAHWNIELHYESINELSPMLWPTVNRPVFLGIKHPSEAYDQIFITVKQLRVSWCGVLSLTRGRVCRLQLLLALPFRRLLRLAGLRWRYSTPPSHGSNQSIHEWTFFYNLGRIDQRPQPRTVRVFTCITLLLFVAAETFSPSRCPATDVRYGSTNSAFRCHVTILRYQISLLSTLRDLRLLISFA